MHWTAPCARGTTDLAAAECRSLGLRLTGERLDAVTFEGDWPDAARALVHLRIPSRLILDLASFDARSADELYDGMSNIAWEQWLDARATFAVFASGDLTDGLRTHVFVALRTKDAIADRLTRRHGRRPDVAREDPDVRVVVRGRRGHWHVGLDVAHPPLHERGFRVAQTEAPLKETLAATVAMAAGWRPDHGPLIDPMCGSGTLIIEAVNLALGLAPGCTRRFSCERWPHHGARCHALLDAERARAVAHARRLFAAPPPMRVEASDLDPNAVLATRKNLAAAGLIDLVTVSTADARTRPLPIATTLLCNPPYGERMGGEDVVSLYRDLGIAWRRGDRLRAWVLDGHEQFAATFGHAPAATRPLRNGRLAVNLRQYVF